MLALYTHDKLCKKSDNCTFCNSSVESVDHMLIFCTIDANLWDSICDWIIELGFLDYKLSDSKKILGYLDSGPVTNCIILLTKMAIYDAFKQGRKSSLFHIKAEVKIQYYLVKYFHYTTRKKQLFEKRWYKLSIYYNDI